VRPTSTLWWKWLKNVLAHQQQLSSFLEARNASEHLLAIRTRSKPPGFILPCQPALADRPPAGPGWLHEINSGLKFRSPREFIRLSA
jgi:hypothetical protein